MSHNKWNDEKIKEILSKAPKIHDERSKEDILKRLKDDGLFDDMPVDDQFKPQRRKKKHTISIVVSIAALCLLAILVPSFFKQIEQQQSSGESANFEAKDAMTSIEMDQSNTMEAETSMSIFNTDVQDLRTAVYPDEVEDSVLLNIGLASDDADSIPITILIPNEKVQEDFGEIMPSAVELYNQYAPKLNELAIGFKEYHPYVGVISEQGDVVVHTLSADQTYDIGTAALTTYYASIIDTFSNSYEEAVFLNEDGSAFEFSEVGEASAPLPLSGELTQYNYFKYTQNDGATYLVPNFRETFDSVEDAILAMRHETNDIYQSVILPEVEFEVSVNKEVVNVTFTEELDLDAYDSVAAMQMIEGILFTAKSFNLNVQFHHIVQTEWQGFDFTMMLPMPIGVNQVSYVTAFP